MEIACPSSCRYLAAAQAHPAAVVKKQQEREVALLASLLDGLGARASEITWGVLKLLSRFAADPLLRLRDEDVVDMAAALGETFATAARGVIYEHRPRSLPAQRLSTEVKAFIEQARRPGERGFEQNVAAALQRLSRGFAEGGRLLADPAPSVCLQVVARAVRTARELAGDLPREEPAPASPSASLLVRP